MRPAAPATTTRMAACAIPGPASALTATRRSVAGDCGILTVVAQRKFVGVDPHDALLRIKVHSDPACVGTQIGPLHAKNIFPAVVAKTRAEQGLAEEELHLGAAHPLLELIDLLTGKVVALLDSRAVGREDPLDALRCGSVGRARRG